MAYAAAEEAPSPRARHRGRTVCAAMAAWRRGDVLDAERLFKKGYKLNPNFAGAFYGLASVYSSISKFKSAHALVARRIGSHRRSGNNHCLGEYLARHRAHCSPGTRAHDC